MGDMTVTADPYTSATGLIERSVAAYKQYDVLLVNAIFDGLNLISKEGPIVNTRYGVLILSENAGAHEELGEWALTVNPFDVSGQAEAIHEALELSSQERREGTLGLKVLEAGPLPTVVLHAHPSLGPVPGMVRARPPRGFPF